jgi:hypothetical protein
MVTVPLWQGTVLSLIATLLILRKDGESPVFLIAHCLRARHSVFAEMETNPIEMPIRSV